ncbi:hypothetical protein GRJ2_002028100 [Grus japonensis]|uniref:Uncharacterized protein n=1 Tax=Grus japonensis TaxID=30415 RepID=A0ABC9XD60_GRUJA
MIGCPPAGGGSSSSSIGLRNCPSARGGGGVEGRWWHAAPLLGSPEAALTGRRAEALPAEAAASRPSSVGLSPARGGCGPPRHGRRERSRSFNHLPMTSDFFEEEPATSTVCWLLIVKEKHLSGKDGCAILWDVHVPVAFRTVANSQALQRGGSSRSWNLASSVGIREYTREQKQVNNELSETGLSSAEVGKNRVGRQELFQSRILLLSVTPKHKDFINFIRSCHQ